VRRVVFFIVLFAILAVLIFFGGALESFLVGAKYSIIHGTPVALTPDWQTYVPKKPLEVSRHHQAVLLQVDEPLKLDDSCWCIGLPDGGFANPEVELVGVNGTLYSLNARSFLNSSRYKAWMLVCERYALSSDFSPDQEFSTVRIRCDRSVIISRIIWMCDDPK
jgi:hypothetical protein